MNIATCPVHGGPPVSYCHKCCQYTWEAATTDPSPERRAATKDMRSEDERKRAPKEIRLTIPWELLASDNLRKGLDRSRYKRYKLARDAAHVHAREQVTSAPYHGSVTLSVLFTVPDNRRRDPNNLTKLLCDALTGVAYKDDDQIHRMSWERTGPDPENAGAYVTVEEA